MQIVLKKCRRRIRIIGQLVLLQVLCDVQCLPDALRFLRRQRRLKGHLLHIRHLRNVCRQLVQGIEFQHIPKHLRGDLGNRRFKAIVYAVLDTAFVVRPGQPVRFRPVCGQCQPLGRVRRFIRAVYRRLCDLQPEHIPVFLFFMRQRHAIVDLRPFIGAGYHIAVIYKHAVIHSPLQLTEPPLIQQIQGVFRDTGHIVMQVVFDHERSQLLVCPDTGHDYDVLQVIGAVDQIPHAHQFAFRILGDHLPPYRPKDQLLMLRQPVQPLGKKV